MAFCTKCGGQLAEGARFCTACGAPAAAPADTPSPSVAQAPKRSPLLWVVPLVLVGVIALTAGGWFVFGLLSGGTAASRAKAQVETVAEFLQGYNEGDLERVRSVLPAEFADEVEAAFNSGADIGIDGEVTREWDGDVLVLTFDYADADTTESMRLTADGGEQRGVVTLEQTGADGYSYQATVVREAGHWVLAEIDGVSVGDALAGIGSVDASDDEESGDEEYYDDSDDSSGGSGSMQADNEAAECWANQEIIESVLWEYMEQEGYDDTVPLAGDLSWDHPILADGYLEVPPSCASAPGSYYYIARDGTTSCPTGEHGYYLDEQ